MAALSLALLTIPAHCQTKTVQLGSNTPKFAYVNDNPFVTLATAVTQNRKSPQFRVTWGGSLGSAWDKGTMLYNRPRKTLSYYDVGGQGEEGEFFYKKYYVFKGITDSALVGSVQKYNNVDKIHQLLAFSFIDTLPKLGYQKIKNTDYSRNRSSHSR